MKRFVNFLIIFILLIPTFLMPTHVQAQTLGDLKKELKELQAQKAEQDKDKQLTQSEIDRINQELVNISIKKDEIDNERHELSKEIENLTKEIEQKDKEIKDVINFVQISNGESAYLEYAFGAQDFTDFIYRMAVSEQLTKHNESLIDKYNQLIEENENKKIELNQKEEELKNAEKEGSNKMLSLGEHLKEISTIKLTVDEQIAAKQKLINFYQNEMGCKDNEDISTCGYKKLPPDTAFYRPVNQAYITSVRGSRSYYLNGKYVQDFHYGMDMAYSGNVPIYSTAAGVVYQIYPDTSCGGTQIYIHHFVNGKKYTSMYGHLKNATVKVGQTVTSNTIIGYMGGNPKETWWDKCSTGQHLHFGIANGLAKEPSSKGYAAGEFNLYIFDAYSFDPKKVVNFPSGYSYFKDRITKY